MTDHNEDANHEKLIEEAAMAILDKFLAPDERHSSWWINPDEMARAALAVFEKAHTPTDDEREALMGAMRLGWSNRQRWWTTTEAPAEAPSDDEFLAIAILAAGFRRSEVPEPSVLTICECYRDGSEMVTCERHTEPQAEPSGTPFYDQKMRELDVVRAQGEPSDAQAEAAAREYHERGNGEGSFDRMADHVRTSLLFRMGCALRAAGEVRS